MKPEKKPVEQGTPHQYMPNVRIAMGKVIRKEWEKMKGEVTSADAFVDHMLDVLKREGFKSPVGKALNARTVRYQVFRNGIRFRKSDRTGTVKKMPNVAPAISVMEEPSAPSVNVKEAAPAVSGMDPLLAAILTNPALTPQKREALIKAFYGVE